ncbi:MAG: hypothetical protein IPF57_13625 [Gammaproteobacteria bacterium]|nr:hypothetical protein [Gammaproteobacteria bacterium]
MIGWVAAKLPCGHAPLNAGHVVSSIQTAKLSGRPVAAFQVEGTQGRASRCAAWAGTGGAWPPICPLSGNPSKFLRGHNIFGSDDLMGKRPVSTGCQRLIR